ncbi:MAG: HD domain-containing protein [Thermodesulfobacteriota bacterium]
MKSRPESLEWKHPEIETFITDHVHPFEGILRRINILDSVKQLLVLLDREGDCSSIARRYDDPKTGNAPKDVESAEWQVNQPDAYDILSRNVSLLEHTLNVASILIEKRKKERKDVQMEMGRLLLVALGHDIGKIPSKARDRFHKDHFLISHAILNEMMPADYPSREEILMAVRDHHFPSASTGSLLADLKAADHQARQLELKTYGFASTMALPETRHRNQPQEVKTLESRKPSYDPADLSWLDIPCLLQRLSDKINIVENGRYEAFSHAGMVYVFPRLIAQYACDQAIQTGRMEIMAFMANEEKMSSLEFALRQTLNEYIPEKLIGERFIGRKFQIIRQDGTRLNPGFYLPLKMTAFSHIPSAEIEKRKQCAAVLQSIHHVAICRSGA